ncbi:MAG TPA: cyclic nucleotide-binding domain-containing protein, partial [Chloroflexota bacterium]|nr:cyclic nucleotide-binding domain-containing protein [Chloroflexota bacterium]
MPLIGRVSLFTSLPRSEIDDLTATLRRLDLPPDRIVVREGEAGHHFSIVLDGQLEVIKAVGTADERLLGVRGPGEFVGEMSLLKLDGLRTASVRTRTRVQLLSMTRTEFDALLRRQPAVAYDLARVLSTHLQEANEATIRD